MADGRGGVPGCAFMMACWPLRARLGRLRGGSCSECACVRAFRRGREAWGRAHGGAREEKRREAKRVCLWELVRAEGVSLEARFPRVPRAPCYAYGLPARAGQLWSVVARDGLDEAGDLAIGCVLLESSEPRKDNSMQC